MGWLRCFGGGGGGGTTWDVWGLLGAWLNLVKSDVDVGGGVATSSMSTAATLTIQNYLKEQFFSDEAKSSYFRIMKAKFYRARIFTQYLWCFVHKASNFPPSNFQKLIRREFWENRSHFDLPSFFPLHHITFSLVEAVHKLILVYAKTQRS